MTRTKAWVAAALLSIGAVAWAVSIRLPSRMPEHPVAFVGLWTFMMLAMMAPSVLPTVLVFATSPPSPGATVSPTRTAVFVAGYLLSWATLGAVVAIGRYFLWPLLALWARPVAAGALVLAGIYQLTSWKRFCLLHCRTPLPFFLQRWRSGATGALAMGAHHGLYCVGCCVGLMAALVTLGMMSPFWMATVALAILAEKVAPRGERLAFPIGAGMIAAGIALGVGWLPFGMPMEGM